jgi:hypothetical protein
MDQGADTVRPILGLSGVEAGEILGVTALTVSQYVAHGVLQQAVRYQHNGLDRADVEQLSLERWKPGRPYWVTERGGPDPRDQPGPGSTSYAARTAPGR